MADTHDNDDLSPIPVWDSTQTSGIVRLTLADAAIAIGMPHRTFDRRWNADKLPEGWRKAVNHNATRPGEPRKWVLIDARSLSATRPATPAIPLPSPSEAASVSPHQSSHIESLPLNDTADRATDKELAVLHERVRSLEAMVKLLEDRVRQADQMAERAQVTADTLANRIPLQLPPARGWWQRLTGKGGETL